MTADQTTAWPRHLQLLWERTKPGRRGPKPGRTIEEIGAAAVEIADREGLAAVSMKAVAEALNLTTMSLYRYVDSKDALLAVMLDVAVGPADVADTSGSWRERVEFWARAIAARRVAHPWSVLVPLNAPPATPNLTAWTESGLGAFEESGLAAQQRLSALLLLDGIISQHIRLSLQLGFLTAGGQSVLDPHEGYPENVLHLADPAALPLLRAAAAETMGDDEDFFEAELNFGLRTALNGIAALVDAPA